MTADAQESAPASPQDSVPVAPPDFLTALLAARTGLAVPVPNMRATHKAGRALLARCEAFKLRLTQRLNYQGELASAKRRVWWAALPLRARALGFRVRHDSLAVRFFLFRHRALFRNLVLGLIAVLALAYVYASRAAIAAYLGGLVSSFSSFLGGP